MLPIQRAHGREGNADAAVAARIPSSQTESIQDLLGSSGNSGQLAIGLCFERGAGTGVGYNNWKCQLEHASTKEKEACDCGNIGIAIDLRCRKFKTGRTYRLDRV